MTNGLDNDGQDKVWPMTKFIEMENKYWRNNL